MISQRESVHIEHAKAVNKLQRLMKERKDPQIYEEKEELIKK